MVDGENSGPSDTRHTRPTKLSVKVRATNTFRGPSEEGSIFSFLLMFVTGFFAVELSLRPLVMRWTYGEPERLSKRA
ncbi:hypothetical protein VFPPC_15358 [Pochonia chlamydosporia 170]|uniref:Uncharacterized protein n=1 Tax=Pochonia chlamydosporia 170 TaxID=1380566 RepID=A0A179G7J9_METCM|nr:hypothetical protein VFPPC_15358 [Pochonia chlamydosporia 170]OAQ73765.1 hypothetical protein VFPPC_15358 [Pochonia chlamydosporia 170]